MIADGNQSVIKTAAYTPRDIYKIAKYHRRLIQIAWGSSLLICALIAIYVMFGILVRMSWDNPPLFSLPQRGLLALAAFTTISCSILVVLWLIAFVQLLAGLRTHIIVRILAITGSFVPLVSLFVLKRVLSRARLVLKRSGYPVGMFGVSRETLRDLKEHSISHAVV